VLSNFLTIGGYLGLFIAGWGLWWGMPGASRGVRTAVLAGGLAIGAFLIVTDALPPFRPNQVIDPAGIGPFALHDAFRVGEVPFVIALWALAWPRTAPAARSQRLAAATVLAAVIGLSAAATRDYFSWNRARWDMLRVAEALGATPDEIDGGFEYNGFKRHEI